MAGGCVDTQRPGKRLKDASLSQIKQRSLSVTRGGPQTAKPEENEPPRDPLAVDGRIKRRSAWRRPGITK